MNSMIGCMPDQVAFQKIRSQDTYLPNMGGTTADSLHNKGVQANLALICGLNSLESEIMSDRSGVSPVLDGNGTLCDDTVGCVFISNVIVHCRHNHHVYTPVTHKSEDPTR